MFVIPYPPGFPVLVPGQVHQRRVGSSSRGPGSDRSRRMGARVLVGDVVAWRVAHSVPTVR